MSHNYQTNEMNKYMLDFTVEISHQHQQQQQLSVQSISNFQSYQYRLNNNYNQPSTIPSRKMSSSIHSESSHSHTYPCCHRRFGECSTCRAQDLARCMELEDYERRKDGRRARAREAILRENYLRAQEEQEYVERENERRAREDAACIRRYKAQRADNDAAIEDANRRLRQMKLREEEAKEGRAVYRARLGKKEEELKRVRDRYRSRLGQKAEELEEERERVVYLRDAKRKLKDEKDEIHDRYKGKLVEKDERLEDARDVAKYLQLENERKDRENARLRDDEKMKAKLARLNRKDEEREREREELDKNLWTSARRFILADDGRFVPASTCVNIPSSTRRSRTASRRHASRGSVTAWSIGIIRYKS